MTQRGKPKVVDLYGNNRPVGVSKPVMHTHLDHAVALLQGYFADDLSGYIVFCCNHKGEWSLGYRADGDTGAMGPTLLAALAKEAINIELTVERMIDRRIGAPVLDEPTG